MWRTMTYATFFVCLVIVASVKGSCLEYGHSCWGAHGKRSGNTGSNKLLRGTTNLRHDELALPIDDNSRQYLANKPQYDSFDELNSSAENLPRSAINSEEHTSADAGDAEKMHNFMDQRRSKFLLHNNNAKDKSNSNSLPDSTERRTMPRVGGHWRRLSFYPLPARFGNNPPAPTYEQRALNIPTRGESDGSGIYYDFK